MIVDRKGKRMVISVNWLLVSVYHKPVVVDIVDLKGK